MSIKPEEDIENMYSFRLHYATPSAFESRKNDSLLGLSTARDRGVSFRGRVRPDAVFLVRTALRAAFEVLWQFEYWNSTYAFAPPDPVVTVHPDKLFFETFSHDRSAHVLLSLDRTLFEQIDEVSCGTSHFEMSAWLWAALGEMRSYRPTWLHLDHKGLELETLGGGGRFEKRCDVSHEWLRSYLELQAASTLGGVSFRVKPVDLLALIRFLRYSRPNTSPKAIRYEFEPGKPVRVVAEPWEETFLLRDSEHSYDRPKSTRLWGRKRLRLLEPLLPFADSVSVAVKGRALPSFYNLELPGMEFQLSLTGWSDQGFGEKSGFHLLSARTEVSPQKKSEALEFLRTRFSISRSELSHKLSIENNEAQNLLRELCREGQACYRFAASEYRYRPLFETQPDFDTILPKDERLSASERLSVQGLVALQSLQPRETRRVRKLSSPAGKKLVETVHRDWCAEGSVDGIEGVEIVLDESDHIIFGRCSCRFFAENLLNLGPCEHLLALRSAAQIHRQEPPSSSEVGPVDEEVARED